MVFLHSLAKLRKVIVNVQLCVRSASFIELDLQPKRKVKVNGLPAQLGESEKVKVISQLCVSGASSAYFDLQPKRKVKVKK